MTKEFYMCNLPSIDKLRECPWDIVRLKMAICEQLTLEKLEREQYSVIYSDDEIKPDFVVENEL